MKNVRKLPLYLSALLVFLGIVGHTVGTAIHYLDMYEYYEKDSLWTKIESLITEWFSR